MNDIFLNDLKVGERARIVSCDIGPTCYDRLKALGLVKGKIVKKVSNLRLKGPVILEVDRACVAIGRGMANKIIVKVIKDE